MFTFYGFTIMHEEELFSLAKWKTMHQRIKKGKLAHSSVVFVLFLPLSISITESMYTVYSLSTKTFLLFQNERHFYTFHWCFRLQLDNTKTIKQFFFIQFFFTVFAFSILSHRNWSSGKNNNLTKWAQNICEISYRNWFFFSFFCNFVTSFNFRHQF